MLPYFNQFCRRKKIHTFVVVVVVVVKVTPVDIKLSFKKVITRPPDDNYDH